MRDSTHIILGLRDEAKRSHLAALERVEKAQRDADKCAVEVDAYDKALKAMGANDDAPETPAPKPRSVKRSAASEKWVSIYRTLHQHASAPYSYEDLSFAVDLAGHEASSGGQRTQMMNAVNAGWFDRAGHGKFEFTESGLALIGATPNENSGSAEPEEAKAESASNTFGFQNPNLDRPGQ